MAPVPSPSVSSSINAVDVSQQDIVTDNAEDKVIHNHSQLNPITFRPVTPIKANRFEELVNGHPNRDLVHYVISGFKQSFTLK